MKLQLCTLFDSNYLDKGLVLHDSLEKCCDDYMLYLLPMDKKCSAVLNDLKLSNVKILDYDDFEDNDLKVLRHERSNATFMWTCTAKLIKYVFKKYDVDICTYIDADMYFYENPAPLIQEMYDASASVQIIKHNFKRGERKRAEKIAGKYCVEFNTFLNNSEGMKVLNGWEADCVKDCSYFENPDVLGDQKYLEKWPNTYKYINISENQGAGVAPWNINKFVLEKKGNNQYMINDVETNEWFKLIFYHFQNIRFVARNEVICCSVNNKIRPIVTEIYYNYLVQIMQKKEMLCQRYGIESLIKIHPAEDSAKAKHIEEDKGNLTIKIFPYTVISVCKIARAILRHWLYHRNEEELIVRME